MITDKSKYNEAEQAGKALLVEGEEKRETTASGSPLAAAVQIALNIEAHHYQSK